MDNSSQSGNLLDLGIEVPANLILKRQQMSVEKLLAFEKKDEYPLGGLTGRVVELEVGGSVVAIGRIAKRFGKVFFQIEEVFK